MSQSDRGGGSSNAGEIAGLAREMGREYRDFLLYYKKREGLSPEEAEAKMQAMVEAGGERRLASMPPPEEMSWCWPEVFPAPAIYAIAWHRHGHGAD